MNYRVIVFCYYYVIAITRFVQSFALYFVVLAPENFYSVSGNEKSGRNMRHI